MKGQPEPEQKPMGLGKKVDDRPPQLDPADDWKYLGKYWWVNKKGQKAYCPPTPESEADKYWRIAQQQVAKQAEPEAQPADIPVGDVTYIETEWYL